MCVYVCVYEKLSEKMYTAAHALSEPTTLRCTNIHIYIQMCVCVRDKECGQI